MHRGAAGADPPPQRLNQSATEQFVGGRDLTRWSRVGGGFVAVDLRLSRYLSANTILVVGKGLADGQVEVRDRRSDERREVPVEVAADEIASVVSGR